MHTVKKKQDHWKYENLHIVLQIPAPSHTHFLSIVDKIIDKKHWLPDLGTIFDCIGRLVEEPKYSVSGLLKHSIKKQDNQKIRGPESQDSMYDCDGIFEWIFWLFSEERVGNEETTNEKENIDSKECGYYE
jgi:hypothetical protein